MLNQYKNFNVKEFSKTFNSSEYYNKDINGFDIIVMQSHENADKLIEELKQVINQYKTFPQQIINLEYDDSSLLEADKKRVKQAIEQYIAYI